MKKLIILLLITLSSHLITMAQDKMASMPPQEFVMARVWKNFSMANASMQGILRTPTKTYPIEMITKDRDILMLIPDADFSVNIAFSSSETVVKTGNGKGKNLKRLSVSEKKKSILDTDITYEDLGLTFLNWPDIREMGTDTIKTLPAFTYDVDAPPGQSAYQSVRFWISSQYYALLRVDAMDKNGQVIKRVEVNGVQKVGNAHVIKEMQVSTFTPGRTSSKSRTYLEIRNVTIQ